MVAALARLSSGSLLIVRILRGGPCVGFVPTRATVSGSVRLEAASGWGRNSAMRTPEYASSDASAIHLRAHCRRTISFEADETQLGRASPLIVAFRRGIAD